MGMQITIAERLRPYSHTPGSSCVLPGSSYQIQVFPTLIRCYDLSQTYPKLIQEIPLDIKGPVKEFTLLNDLEQGCVRIWGYSPAGFFRYCLTSQESGKGIQVEIEKAPWKISSEKQYFFIDAENSFPLYHPPLTDRLSLGNHKAQDWDLVKRRLDLTGIFPAWYRLGQIVSARTVSSKFQGTAALLQNCEAALREEKPEHVLQSFQSLFQAGFHGILVPRLEDDQYQGFVTQTMLSTDLSPLILLTEGVRLIRQLFIQQQQQEIIILPVLPPEFHCGRLLQTSFESGTLDLEWSKKIIRRMNLFSSKDQEMVFHFKKHVRSFRLRREKNDKGKRIVCGTSLYLEKNCYYFFDNFE